MNEIKNNILFHPVVVVIIILITSIISYYTGGLGTITGIVIALVALWLSGFNWKIFGLQKPEWTGTIGKAFIYAVLIFIVFDIILQPVFEVFTGKINLSNLDFIRGNFHNYVLFSLLMWVMAAFGEELLYRGYLMKQLGNLLGNSQFAWVIAAAIIGLVFGLAHIYQGVTGVITTGTIGFFFGIIFSKNRDNLWLLIFIHGIYDMIGITLIYLDCERVIIDTLLNFIK